MHLTIPNAPCLLNVISGIPVFWVPGPFQMLARTSNFRSTKVLKKEKILFSKFIYSIGIPGFTGPIWCRLFMCFPITHDVRIPQVLNFLFYLYFPNSFYEFHLWKSFLYEMAIWRGLSRYQRRQTPGHCIRGPGIAWLRFGNHDHLPQVQVDHDRLGSGVCYH